MNYAGFDIHAHNRATRCYGRTTRAEIVPVATLDDSIAVLGGKVLAVVPDLLGRVHEDYVRFMMASCDALLLACAHRRAARREPQAQRMERAA